jgi:outer membrane protein assembly factor BamB
LLAENPTATAYDVSTGEVVVSTKCLGGEVAPSPAFARGTMVIANEYAKLTAISLASGRVLWSGEDDLPNVASPLATEEFVFTANASGVVNCYAIGTGQKLWTHEFDESFYPSPIFAAGRIYAMDNGGTMHVFRASKEFISVADSTLGEPSRATPAFSGDTLFIRGEEHLYCIGAKQQ